MKTTKTIKKIKWQDWAALVTLMVLLLIFPITNALIAGLVNEGLRALTNLIDMGINQISLVGMVAFQPLGTLLAVYIAWRVHSLTKIKLPAKTKDRKTEDRVKAKLNLIED